jgi:hypothetical protein
MQHDDTSRFQARLTLDMVESLLEHFDRFAGNGVVTLEVNAAGIWFVDPVCDRVIFLGQADLTEKQRERILATYH